MSDVENLMDQDGNVQETPEQKETTAGALSAWIALHPRKVLWFIVLALIPYLLLCWGSTLTVLGALLTSGGCGG